MRLDSPRVRSGKCALKPNHEAGDVSSGSPIDGNNARWSIERRPSAAMTSVAWIVSFAAEAFAPREAAPVTRPFSRIGAVATVNSRTTAPHEAAWRTSVSSSAAREIPSAVRPAAARSGRGAWTERPFASANRQLSMGIAPFATMASRMPRRASTAHPSAERNSPQTLSRGKRSRSSNSVLTPRDAESEAIADPAGPPPITRSSVRVTTPCLR